MHHDQSAWAATNLDALNAAHRANEPIPGSVEWLRKYPNAPMAVGNTLNQPVVATTVDFAVNVRHTYKGDTPSTIERASVAFHSTGQIVIRNRSGDELRLDADAAVALAILLRDTLLVPVKVASFGSAGAVK